MFVMMTEGDLYQKISSKEIYNNIGHKILTLLVQRKHAITGYGNL